MQQLATVPGASRAPLVHASIPVPQIVGVQPSYAPPGLEPSPARQS